MRSSRACASGYGRNAGGAGQPLSRHPALKRGVKRGTIRRCTASCYAGTPPVARCPGGSLPLKRAAPGAGTVPPEDARVSAPRPPDTPATSLHALHAAFLALVLPKVLSHGRVYFR